MFNFNIHKVNFDEEIGQGAHGTVYGCQQKHTGDDKYVVKRIMTAQIETMISTIQEIVLGFSCDHPNVIPIKGYHLSYDKVKKFWEIYIKMPRMEISLKKKIEEYVREGKTFKEEDIVRYFYSLTLGLKYLHSRNIAHRDIKPDNILLDKNDNLRIGDIGIAKLVEDEGTDLLTRALRVPLYTAPEVLTHSSELKKKDLYMADVWSLGVITAELCVPKTRLVNIKETGKGNEAELAEILRGLQDRYDKKLLDLISSLLRVDPNERKSLEEVQRVLEETYPHILAQDKKKREQNAQEQEEIEKLQKQIQDLQNQLETFKLLSVENRNIPQIANSDFNEIDEERKLDEQEPNRDLLRVVRDNQEVIGPQSFKFHSLLGKGSFSKIYLVEKISNNKLYAMKVLLKDRIVNQNLTRYTFAERNILSIMNHPFIVKLNYAFQTEKNLYLILDYCPGGDLGNTLTRNRRFSEDLAKIYAAEIILALEALHNKDIVYRDLKPDNVVLDAEGHALLIDFGLSKEGVKEALQKSFCGSVAYLAPEMLRRSGHNKTLDWYSLGCLIYEMLVGMPPFFSTNRDELFENIKKAQLKLPRSLSEEVKDLIIHLLKRDTTKRLGNSKGASEIKSHPWFKDINWQDVLERKLKPPVPERQIPRLNGLANLQVEENYFGDNNHIAGWSFIHQDEI